jgi:hypothetical protein
MQAAIFPQIISWFRSPLMPNEQFFLARLWWDPGLMLEGDSGKEVALWLLTSLCTSAKREVEVAL